MIESIVDTLSLKVIQGQYPALNLRFTKQLKVNLSIRFRKSFCIALSRKLGEGVQGGGEIRSNKFFGEKKKLDVETMRTSQSFEKFRRMSFFSTPLETWPFWRLHLSRSLPFNVSNYNLIRWTGNERRMFLWVSSPVRALLNSPWTNPTFFFFFCSN